jgi:hypothetical protein
MVRRNLSADDLQETRFPGTIAADERNPLTGVDAQRRVLEQRQVTEGERNGIKGEQGHGESLTFEG